jgi:hypothetical protein
VGIGRFLSKVDEDINLVFGLGAKNRSRSKYFSLRVVDVACGSLSQTNVFFPRPSPYLLLITSISSFLFIANNPH